MGVQWDRDSVNRLADMLRGGVDPIDLEQWLRQIARRMDEIIEAARWDERELRDQAEELEEELAEATRERDALIERQIRTVPVDPCYNLPDNTAYQTKEFSWPLGSFWGTKEQAIDEVRKSAGLKVHPTFESIARLLAK